jgi:hypothetical protein
MLCAGTASSQPFPSGGFQGGTHGNVKAKIWSGAVDEKWNEPGNWCPAGVPGAQDDVVIPEDSGTMPEINVAGMSCKKLTVQEGATLTISAGYTLMVNGKDVTGKQAGP